MDVRCSSGSTSLAKKIRSLKLRSAVTSHRKLTTTIWEAHWSWSLKTTREVAQELNVNYSTVVWHLKQILKVKKLDTRVLGSFLGKKLMALLWLWVCGLSSHTFSSHHTSPVMLPSLANLDPFSNLSCFHLTHLEDVALMHLITKLWSSRSLRGAPYWDFWMLQWYPE